MFSYKSTFTCPSVLFIFFTYTSQQIVNPITEGKVYMILNMGRKLSILYILIFDNIKFIAVWLRSYIDTWMQFAFWYKWEGIPSYYPILI